MGDLGIGDRNWNKKEMKVILQHPFLLSLKRVLNALYRNTRLNAEDMFIHGVSRSFFLGMTQNQFSKELF